MEQYYSICVEERKSSVAIETHGGYTTKGLLDMNSHLVKKNEFHVVYGKRFFDVLMFAEHYGFFAISDKFRNLLRESGIVGWNCFPIKIIGTELKYYVFVVETFVGHIENLERKNKYIDNFYEVDMSGLGNSGIFSIKNTLKIMCTKGVKEVIEEAGITNISFRETLINNTSSLSM